MNQPGPAAIIIGPMGVGQVVDAALALVRRNYRYLVVVAAWGMVVSSLISLLAEVQFGKSFSMLANPSLARGSVAGDGPVDLLGEVLPEPPYWALTALAGLVGIWAHGALLVACGLLIQPTGNQRPTAGEAYRAAVGRLVALLAQGVLLFIAGVVAVAGLALLAVVSPVFLAGLLVLAPLGFYVAVRLTVAWPALFIERLGPISSLRRSWQLTHGAWWHTFGVGMVTLIVALVLSVLVGALAAVAGVAYVFTGDTATITTATAVLSLLASVLVAPLSPAFGAVLLYELRARYEGYDLMQRAVGAPAP